jgi:hypothetical protein
MIHMSDPSVDRTLQRVRSEFLEMPGLKLTAVQAQKLWGLDSGHCGALLERLVALNFLLRTCDGAFVRVDQGSPAQARFALPGHVPR